MGTPLDFYTSEKHETIRNDRKRDWLPVSRRVLVTESHNIYWSEVIARIPQVLASFDANPLSKTYGIADRQFWAWKSVDFPNATHQCTIHGLTQLWVEGQFPWVVDEARQHERINSAIMAIAKCTNRDGSANEALPYEHSWCVTALSCYDLLKTVQLMTNRVDSKQRTSWLTVIEPLAHYLYKFDEQHARISNHVATGAAALGLWAVMANDEAARRRAASLTDRLITWQSDEGWYPEYQGADPGYQTLTIGYLSDLYKTLPSHELAQSIRSALVFLSYCIHPDGSFGGNYGSRNTRFFAPGGFHRLSEEFPIASAIATEMADSVHRRQVVTLSSIDSQNLAPFFNSYAVAASVPLASGANVALPCQSTSTWRYVMPSAGLIVDSGPEHYTVISVKKGGALQHYLRSGKTVVDSGIIVRKSHGEIGSTQLHDDSTQWTLREDRLEIVAQVRRISNEVPTVLRLMSLRIAAISIMRVRKIRELIKLLLVRRLITHHKSMRVFVLRTIRLGSLMEVDNQLVTPVRATIETAPHSFTSIHMASQGYWQLQDELQ